MVDSDKKGAIVGVRKIGETTNIFTPTDLEKLPNPKLSPEAQAALAAIKLTEGSTASESTGKEEEKA